MRSDNVKRGDQAAPARSLFNALGYTKEEMERPLVGIVSSYNEIVPGHMNLDKITQAVKLGVAEAGGTPVVFPAIAVCDGIAMGHIGMKYSLVTRDLIADSTECMALAHQFDALVMIPNCDKNVPGLLMAAARVNIPTVFVSGGPMLAGHVHGKKRSLSSMFEAVGEKAAGRIDEAELDYFAEHVCPTCGSCSGMYTANSMNCLTEVIGMGLRGNGTIPAVYSERIRLAKQAGYAVMEMYRRNIRPRDIMTKEAFMNAMTMDMALGCSTNTMLHLPAIAHEAGVELNMEIANEISARTPNLCHLAPAGPTYMEDLNEAGGVYAVMNELNKKDLLNLDCMTVTGKTVGENIKNAVNMNPEVIRPIENPYMQEGGIAVLKGNIAPDTGIVKRSAVAPSMMTHEGPARVFDCEEDAISAILGGKINLRPTRVKYETLVVINRIAIHQNLFIHIPVGTANDVIDPQYQFLRGKRLGDIVITALFQADDAVKFLIPGRHENYRHIGISLTDLFDQVKAGFISQHNIQNPEVNIVISGMQICFIECHVGTGFISLFFKVALYKLIQIPFVFYNTDYVFHIRNFITTTRTVLTE